MVVLVELFALHPRVEVRTLTVDIEDMTHGAVTAVAAALDSPGGAALHALRFTSTLPTDATASLLAAALQLSCPELHFLCLTERDAVFFEQGKSRVLGPGLAALLALRWMPRTPLRPYGLVVSAVEERLEWFGHYDDSDDSDGDGEYDYDDAAEFGDGGGSESD